MQNFLLFLQYENFQSYFLVKDFPKKIFIILYFMGLKLRVVLFIFRILNIGNSNNNYKAGKKNHYNQFIADSFVKLYLDPQKVYFKQCF